MKTSTTKPRVYIGEAETDATKGRYIGIEFTPEASSRHMERHNIGTNNDLIEAKYALNRFVFDAVASGGYF